MTIEALHPHKIPLLELSLSLYGIIDMIVNMNYDERSETHLLLQ